VIRLCEHCRGFGRWNADHVAAGAPPVRGGGLECGWCKLSTFTQHGVQVDTIEESQAVADWALYAQTWLRVDRLRDELADAEIALEQVRDRTGAHPEDVRASLGIPDEVMQRIYWARRS
jgi:hypothetical protein